MSSPRLSAGLIAAVLLLQLAMLPWTAHLYDTTAFFEVADRVFFAHTPLAKDWAFGSILLLVLLFSQAPILFAYQWATLMPVRITLLKLPFWLTDIGTALVIRRFSSDAGSANLWAFRYLADPTVIFVTAFHGQQDALPNLLVVGSLGLMLLEKYELAGVALGVGTGAKFFPAAFMPLLFVVALRRKNLACACLSAGAFLLTAAAALLPVFWGRLGAVSGEYTTNSFGQAGTHVSPSSLWYALPQGLHIAPRTEQLVAMAVPILLALLECRHRPEARDIARTALVIAMSIVLLNPGAHPTFPLWFVGPLVFYAAVTGDGFISLAGLALSTTEVMAQFCQEGPGEYYLLNFGSGAAHDVFRCVGTRPLNWITLAATAAIVTVLYGPAISTFWKRLFREAAQALALVCVVAFCVSVGIDISSASASPLKPYSFSREESWLNTISVAPYKDGALSFCKLTYDAGDAAFFAGEPFAARFVKASLGYTLYSPDTVVIRGIETPVGSLPSSYGGDDLLSVEQQPVRVSRSFDVTRRLFPFRTSEEMLERPCSLIANNPLLVYRFSMAEARRDAYAKPVLQRFEVFSRAMR